MDAKIQKKIEELQILEQSSQGILAQKQPLQSQLAEIENAVDEIAKTNSDYFKIIGQVMIKSSKEELKKELSEKKSYLELRIKKFEEQENEINSKLEKIRNEITKELK